MKRLKLTFAALAVLIAVGGALQTNASNHKVKVSTTGELYWFDESGTTQVDPTAKSLEDRQLISTCDGDEQVCERGYSSEQFNTPGVPSSGINPAEINNYVPILMD